MKLPNKTLEKSLFASGYSLIYAVDEVGMGCLAGPVVVCAVGFTNHFYNKTHRKFCRLRDSKLIQPKQREKFAEELMKEKDLVYALAYARPKTIDKLNIYNAARLAMRRAVEKASEQIVKTTPTLAEWQGRGSDRSVGVVLVDGKTKINGLNIDQIPIIKGDRKVFAIACASIIAKVHRDKMMTRYAKKYPGYGFEKHKGYGTAQHRARLALVGPCAIHRRSFRLKY